LLDPYAREIVGKHQWRKEHLAYASDPYSSDLNDSDNAAFALKARVRSDGARHESVRPQIRPQDVVLYEVHVKGFSQLLPDIPEAMRGSYAALSHPAAIAHFKAIGVTTLCLLPVHYHLDEVHLVSRGLRNYWAYNTLGFFCPDPCLAINKDDSGAAIGEFKDMVSVLHQHGIEVVLDVVYNHTPEGDEHGPNLSFRGLDNASWYVLNKAAAQKHENHTGCGNTLRISHPFVIKFASDSLRYWVEIMGVDGFRFDLAATLGRKQNDFDSASAFFTVIQQDPVLSRVSLIAEPWDIGPGGYQLGNFPGEFLEWNDKYRDSIRRYWLRLGTDRGEFVQRFMASSDLFKRRQRRAVASVNYVVAHDGYTLRDLVTYQAKHNVANGENNRDGRDGELACNFGIEGLTDDADVNERRKRVSRATLATLLLSQGTPMLCAGDEIGKTQGGNNNAYCQDNATSWLDWTNADRSLTALVTRLLQIRRENRMLHCPDWLGPDDPSKGVITWKTAEGALLNHQDWHSKDSHAISALLEQLGSAKLLLIFNPHDAEISFNLPAGVWELSLNTAEELNENTVHQNTMKVPSSSVCVLQALS
jgi:glycogen operon protein